MTTFYRCLGGTIIVSASPENEMQVNLSIWKAFDSDDEALSFFNSEEGAKFMTRMDRIRKEERNLTFTEVKKL